VFLGALLHELYRLHHSQLAAGGAVDKHVAKSEAAAAFQFAERFHQQV
jgi:hypothetical protein